MNLVTWKKTVCLHTHTKITSISDVFDGSKIYYIELNNMTLTFWIGWRLHGRSWGSSCYGASWAGWFSGGNKSHGDSSDDDFSLQSNSSPPHMNLQLKIPKQTITTVKLLLELISSGMKILFAKWHQNYLSF